MRIAFALLLLFASMAGAKADAQDLIITHVNLVDGRGGAPLPDMAVLVRGPYIADIEPTGQLAITQGARVIEGGGRSLIPGLWDMHVHVLREGRPESYFPLFIANGIVGVRDMGGNFELPRIAQLKADIAAGTRLGPQVVAPGPILDGPWPQLPSISVALADPAAARAEVQRLKAGGADFVKVYNRLPREVFLAIADESKRQGLAFAGHVPMSVSAREASDAGQKSIEHLFNVLFACSSREDELMQRKAIALGPGEASERRRLRRAYLRDILDSADPARCQALFERFARNGTWMTPTLVQRTAFALPDAELGRDPLRRFVLQSMRPLWDPQQDRRIQGRDPEDREIERRFYERDLALIAPMRGAGVRFLAGTDAGDPYSIPGYSLHRELELLVQAGLTPMEALQSATRNAAEFLQRSDRYGTIERGKIADLVLLNADPIRDIRNTRAIAAVVLGGRYFDRGALDRLLEDAATAAARY
jgi:imidazolonepropionase-like amidohydrolase